MNAPQSQTPPPGASSQSLIERGRRVLEIEAQAVSALAARLDASFAHAVNMILECSGRVVVSGIGKSGHIARKIASTLASTGTPAFFVHPADASHGDLGMIEAKDVVIAISHSGESFELVSVIPLIKRKGARLIAITGKPQSTLARQADAHLDAAVQEEACPLGLAPTASTTAALALGDALAVALLEARGFSAEDFARSHPGGALGRRLLTYVNDIMRTGSAIPRVSPDTRFTDAIVEISKKGMGMVAVVDASDTVVGIFTDGDLRRNLGKAVDFHGTFVRDLMTPNPRTIRHDQLAVDAVKLMEDHKISQLLVLDAGRKLVGALSMHDLLQAKVV